MDQLVSVMLTMFFVIISIGTVLTIGNGVLDRAETASHVQDAESLMKHVRDNIYQVVAEGNGSLRKMNMVVKAGFYEVNSPDNSIIYYIDGSEMLDYLSRKSDNNIYIISGTEADCLQDDNYIYISNSRINATFQKVGSPDSWSSIDTASNLLLLRQMDTGISISLANSSISINDAPESSYGNGYSELVKEDEDQPFCTVHFFINSSYGQQYDVYYTIFSGADFIVQEILGSMKGKSVTTSYALHINSTDLIRVNDTTNLSTDVLDKTYIPEKAFISSEANSTVFSIVFAGSRFQNISLNTTYAGSNYQIKLRQNYDSNRVLVVFTNGTWQNINDHLWEISTEKIVGAQFGYFPVDHHDNVRTAVALIMNDIAMKNTLRWGSGNFEIIIKNLGKVNNITNLGIY